jgi:ribokinase
VIPAAPSRRVAVVGAINVDVTVAVPRLPGPGETVVGDDARRHGGGKGANAAVAAARVGASVLYIGAVGQDDDGDRARAELEREHVDCAGLARLADRTTGIALIAVDPTGENQIAVGAGANHALDPDWVTARLSEAAGELGCVLVSTEIAAAAVFAAVTAATAAGVPCILNPAPPLPGLDRTFGDHPVLTPNRTELAALVGDAEEDVSVSATALAQRTQAPVLVTLGADGALIAEPSDGAEPTRLPAHAVKVVDATGAGDTVNGVLAARIAAGDAFADAAATALLAGSLSTTAAGARGGMPAGAQLARAGM